MPSALTAYTPSDIMITAKALIASGFLPRPVDSPDKAFAIITLSNELGIGMWQGFNGINVIQGKPTVSPQLMLALINRSNQLEDMQIEATAEFARVTMKRRGRTAHTETFTIKDAAAQGLTSKDNYKKQPAVMLKWRAVVACARIVFPDAIMGLYTSEEMGADVTVTEDGDMTVIAPAASVVVEREPYVEPLIQIELTTVSREVDKQNRDYYRFNDGAYSYSRIPFVQAEYDAALDWQTYPVSQPFALSGLTAYCERRSDTALEVVSVVRHE